MNNVLTLPDLDRRRRRQDVCQALRLRIDRRARELAQREQERYFKAILFDVYRGALHPELIAWWEPLTGGVGAQRR